MYYFAKYIKYISYVTVIKIGLDQFCFIPVNNHTLPDYETVSYLAFTHYIIITIQNLLWQSMYNTFIIT